jgi:hypothetical protein
MSGRAGFVGLVAFVVVVLGAAPVPADPAQAACAQRSPDRAISSPGETGEAQTPHVVAYFAVIGTRPG